MLPKRYRWGNQTVYSENYPVIAAAVRARYPNVTLIATCDITANGTVPVAGGVDLFDYHIYQGSADNFLQQQFQWDDWPRGPGIPKVFASEYATVTSVGNGNLQGAREWWCCRRCVIVATHVCGIHSIVSVACC